MSGLTPEELALIPDEALRTKIANEIKTANDATEFQKTEAQKAFAKRDELKNTVRDLTVKLESAQGTDVTKIQSELTATKTELEGLKPVIEGLKLEAQTAKTRAEALEKQTRADEISKLPESHKALAEKITDIDLLKEYVKLNSVNAQRTVDTNKSLPADYWTGKKWEDLSVSKRDLLYNQNPTLYNQLKLAYEKRNKH